MKANMGNLDRGLRIILAVVFAALYFTNIIGGTAGLILLILGIVFVLTSFIGFCPLYLPFGISTNKEKNKKL
jgi:hypothetical protein